MKKIFSILLLFACSFAHSQIGQFSPIWTYTGSNIQFTNGSTNTSSLNVNGPLVTTGTFSVGSTATVSGVITTNSIVANTGQLRLYSGTNSDLILRAVGANQAITSEINGSPKFQVNSSGATVTGSLITTGTHSLGSANLTGGNTGTVAVLSDALFDVTLNSYGGNPADGGTYYFGNNIAGLVNNSSFGQVKLPYNCTLVAWDLNWYGSPGTSESSTLSINGTTNYTLTSVAIFSAAAAVGSYSANGLSQSFSANDVLNIKWVSPTWATNPTALYLGVTLWFVRRS